MTVKLTIQNQQAQTEVVRFASALIIKVLKERPRDGKKQKNIKHSGSITLTRLSTLPDRCSTGLWLENSLGTIKRP